MQQFNYIKFINKLNCSEIIKKELELFCNRAMNETIPLKQLPKVLKKEMKRLQIEGF